MSKSVTSGIVTSTSYQPDNRSDALKIHNRAQSHSVIPIALPNWDENKHNNGIIILWLCEDRWCLRDKRRVNLSLADPPIWRPDHQTHCQINFALFVCCSRAISNALSLNLSPLRSVLKSISANCSLHHSLLRGEVMMTYESIY